MPAVMKTTFIFELGDRGWTESFVRTNSSDNIAEQQALALLLAQKRALLLGEEASIKAVRTSIEINSAGQAVVGDALLSYYSLDGVVGQPSDAPDTALDITFRTLNGAKRKVLFMRGIWDAVVTEGGQYDPTAGNWQINFNSWVASVIANNWGWWGNDVLATPTVVNYDQNAPTLQVIVTLGANTFTAPFGKRFHVRFASINGKSVLNGAQIVESIDATSCQLVKPLAVGPFVSSGKMTLYSQVVRVTSTVEAIRIIERKAGAPLLVSRGRQRARART